MFDKTNRIALTLVLLIASAPNVSVSYEASDLPLLEKNIVGACPKVWEPMYSRLRYINGQETVAEPGVVFADGMDIWHQDRTDKIRYIAYSYSYLAAMNADLVMDHASTDGAVITACSNARKDYFDTQIQIHHVDTLTAQTILDTVRDGDNDGKFNSVDQCQNTSTDGVAEGTGEFSIGIDFEVDEVGCAAWERDEDGDNVSDHYDFCLGTLASVSVVGDGCHDTDDDGVSDRTDLYPFQNDYLCVP